MRGWLVSALLINFLGFSLIAGAQSLPPKSVLTIDRMSTHKFVLPGATSARFESKTKDPVKRSLELELFRKRLAQLSAVNTTLTTLPLPQRNRYLSCVTHAIDERTTLSLEAISQLCAVSKSSDPKSVDFVVTYDADTNNTFVILNGEYNEDLFGILSGRDLRPIATQKTQISLPPPCDDVSLCNPCKAIDNLGLGLVTVKESERTRNIWNDLMMDLVLEISEDKRRVLYSNGTQELFYYQLGSHLTQKQIEKHRKKFKKVGMSIEPSSARVMKDTRNKSFTTVSICMECPAGSLSNGVNDCVRNGCSVFTGCNTICKRDEILYNGTCVPNCHSQCENIRNQVNNMLKVFERLELTEDDRNSLKPLVESINARIDDDLRLCQRENFAPVCRSSHYAHAIFQLTMVGSTNRCTKNETDIPVAPQQEMYGCGGTECIWGKYNFRYTDSAVVGNCPLSAVESAIEDLRNKKWRSKSGPVCRQESISSKDVFRYLADNAYNCDVYVGTKQK